RGDKKCLGNGSADVHSKGFVEDGRKRPVNAAEIFFLEAAERQLFDRERRAWGHRTALYAFGRRHGNSRVTQRGFGSGEGVAADARVDEKELLRRLVDTARGEKKMVAHEPEWNLGDR